MIAPMGYVSPGQCENPHPSPRPAIVLLTMLNTTSVDSQVMYCHQCFIGFVKEWISLAMRREPDISYELQPVWIPDDWETDLRNDDASGS